jgi:hypothetical protein
LTIFKLGYKNEIEMKEMEMGRNFTRCMIRRSKENGLQIIFAPYFLGLFERGNEIDFGVVGLTHTNHAIERSNYTRADPMHL